MSAIETAGGEHYWMPKVRGRRTFVANAKEMIMGSFDASEGMDRVEDAADTLTDRVSSIAGQVGKRVSDTADKVQNSASNAISTVQEKGAAAADSANEVATTLGDALRQSARTQPLTTVALSITAGFLLGAMWKIAR